MVFKLRPTAAPLHPASQPEAPSPAFFCMGVPSAGSASSVASDSSGGTYYTATAGGGNPCVQAGGAAAFSTADVLCIKYEDVNSLESYPESSDAPGSPAPGFQESPISSPVRSSGGDWYCRALALDSASPSSQITGDLPDPEFQPGPMNYYAFPEMPCVMTPRLMALGEEAVLAYELACADVMHRLPDTPEHEHRPFYSFSREGLEHWFNSLADAKNAVFLRKSAVAADIAESLRELDSQLRIYCWDEVFLKSAAYEIDFISEESSESNLRINFSSLERLRSLSRYPFYGVSFVEKNSAVFSSTKLDVQTRGDGGWAAHNFVADPHCLTEHHLPLFKPPHK
ncbi:hypothetical protein HYPSUDRAFT_209969 [Hypholoma sublateritium FD-334 SS-4]|uniref:Uncharacterized protein n=1 Tax=Hypholoma sublateritium (strain FD-334 SS-4) TaxID=945553 RepID=A0A0D2KEJ8_HYPSF|nr:hypothetical protein HYPSUDRAFT_209969 [Hypholoma sublateritium FD-334 SS-4]